MEPKQCPNDNECQQNNWIQEDSIEEVYPEIEPLSEDRTVYNFLNGFPLNHHFVN